MTRPRNFRAYILLVILLIVGVTELVREHRPSFLRPGLRLCAYVSTADGSVTVIDLVKLAPVARVAVGPGLSGMREHPTRRNLGREFRGRVCVGAECEGESGDRAHSRRTASLRD